MWGGMAWLEMSFPYSCVFFLPSYPSTFFQNIKVIITSEKKTLYLLASKGGCLGDETGRCPFPHEMKIRIAILIQTLKFLPVFSAQLS